MGRGRRNYFTIKNIGVVVVIVLVFAFIKWYMFPIVRDGVDRAGIRWEYNTFSGTLKLQATENSNGKMQDYYYHWDNDVPELLPPWYNYRKRCRKVVFGPGIKYIGNYTCRDFERLSSIELSEKIETIGDCAFYCCKHLKKLDCPASLRQIGESAFEGCELEELVLNEGLQSLYPDAFSGAKMEKVKIPNTVVRICDGVFAENEELEEINIPESIDMLGVGVFAGDINLKRVRVETTKLEPRNGAFTGTGPDVVVEVPKEKYKEYSQGFFVHGLQETAKVVAY